MYTVKTSVLGSGGGLLSDSWMVHLVSPCVTRAEEAPSGILQG